MVMNITDQELTEAHRALLSTLQKCEKIDAEKLPQSQQTLLAHRIASLKVALVLIEKETASAEAPDRLAKFEAVYQEISDSVNSIPAELESLKAAGKEKTVRYKELFGQKLMNNHIVSLFERHGIPIEKGDA